jgi:hypothetical protein
MCAVASALEELGPASENGRLRHGDRGQGPGDRRRTGLMLTIPPADGLNVDYPLEGAQDVATGSDSLFGRRSGL